MKKIISTFLTFLLIISAAYCYGQSTNGSRRAVVELFTGTWGQYCPAGEWYCDTLQKTYQDSAMILAWHGPVAYAEPLAHKGGDSLAATFGIGGYPSALLNRAFIGGFGQIGSKPYWTMQTSFIASLNKTPLLDISISDIKNYTFGPSTVEFDVSVSPIDKTKLFSEDTTTYALVVVLTEDDIIEPQQNNGDNGYPAGTINDFIHNNVVRAVAGSAIGDSLPLMLSQSGTVYPITKHFSVNVDPSWQRSKLRIKTFVIAKHPKDKIPQYHEILNGVQSGYLSSHVSVKKTADRFNNGSLVNYPNPFSATTNINFEVPERNFVTISVRNELGVEVARLVNENLDAGTYSVDMSAQNLANGLYTYILESGSTKLVGKMAVVK